MEVVLGRDCGNASGDSGVEAVVMMMAKELAYRVWYRVVVIVVKVLLLSINN